MSTQPAPVPMPGPDVLPAPDRPPIGLPVIFGMILLVLSGAAVVIGDLADDFTPLGVPSYLFVYLGTGAAIALVVGRSAVAAFGIFSSKTQQFGHGFSTYLAVGLATLEGLPVVVGQLADASNPLNVDPIVWAKATAAISVALLVGKYLQGASVFLNRFKADPSAAQAAFDEAKGAGFPPVQPGEQPPAPPGDDVGGTVGDQPGAGPGEGLPQG